MMARVGKSSVTVILEDGLLSTIREAANRNRRTISGEVTVLIEAALRERKMNEHTDGRP